MAARIVMWLTAVAGVIVVIASATIIYLDRERTLSVDEFIDKDMTMCGEAVPRGSDAYRDITMWLEENRHGWRIYVATDPDVPLLLTIGTWRMSVDANWVGLRDMENQFGVAKSIHKETSTLKLEYAC